MPDPAGGFQHLPARESQPLQALVNVVGNSRRRVIGVQGASPNRPDFILGKDRRHDFGPPLPGIAWVAGQGLGQFSPSAVLDEDSLFLGGSQTTFRLELFQGPDCGDVVVETFGLVGLLQAGVGPDGVVYAAGWLKGIRSGGKVGSSSSDGR